MLDLVLNNKKFMITNDGGLAINLINKTGANSIKGTLVQPGSVDLSCALTALDCDYCFGVMYSNGVPDGNDVWIVVSGIADIRLAENEGTVRGNWARTHSTEVGHTDATGGSPAAAPTHFQEIGHVLETVNATGGGTWVLAKIALHFL